MEGLSMKANRHLRFQKCLPTENSQSGDKVSQGRVIVNGEFADIFRARRTGLPC